MEYNIAAVLILFVLTVRFSRGTHAHGLIDSATTATYSEREERRLQKSSHHGTKRKDAMADILYENRKINKEIARGKMEHILIEGDILVHSSNSSRNRRTVTTREGMKWPGAVVPYMVDTAFKEKEKRVIFGAMQRFQEESCIKFRKRTIEPDYLFITPAKGCWSMVGRQGGMQKLSLVGTCKVRKGTIMHELMHCLGFRHEHNRPDRDNFIRILWYNIKLGYNENFIQHSSTEVDTMHTVYDYFSIMHYPLSAFSSNAHWTIHPLQLHHSYGAVGSRHDFSEQDISRLNQLYNCGACTDTDTLYCPVWAMRGECQRNTAWMVEHCPHSCDTCPERDGNKVLLKNCDDQNNQCPHWARRGECARNPSYMERHCRRSCQLCYYYIHEQEEVEENDECRDQNSLCPEWAILGECTRSTFMQTNCKESCQLCNTGSAINRVCQDNERNCPAWARDGLCRTHSSYMLASCRKSCEVCVADPPAEKTRKKQKEVTNEILDETIHHDDNAIVNNPVVKCKDKKKQCTTWAAEGQCEEYKHWMAVNCPKSCDTCDTLVNISCVDVEKKCPLWATKKECRKNKGWLIPNCQFSCNACDQVIPTCVNLNRSCRKKAKKGLCEKKKKTRKECPYSCNLCES